MVRFSHCIVPRAWHYVPARDLARTTTQTTQTERTMPHYHLTPVSANVKTGPIPVSTSSAETCPTVCPFRGSGCYAESGPLGLHWMAVTRAKRGTNWGEFLDAVRGIAAGSLWRHNQAGDLPGMGNRIARRARLPRAAHAAAAFAYHQIGFFALAGRTLQIAFFALDDAQITFFALASQILFFALDLPRPLSGRVAIFSLRRV